MDNPTSGELIDTINDVAMSLDDFERFMSERLPFSVERVQPGCWHVREYSGDIAPPAGIVTALEVGDYLSVAVHRHMMFGWGEKDAEGNVTIHDDGTIAATRCAQRMVQTLRDGLQAVGALPVGATPTHDASVMDTETDEREFPKRAEYTYPFTGTILSPFIAR